MSAPGRISRLVGVEVLKVTGGRTIKIGLLAVAAVAAFTAWGHEPADHEETAWAVAKKSFGAGLWAAEIFLLVAGTTALAGETAMGTLKMILPHAYRRSDWVAAKAIVLVGEAILLLATAMATALVAGMLSGGLSDVVQHFEADFSGAAAADKVLHSSSEMYGHLFHSALVALASLAATALLGLFISCVFDAVIPALSAGFLLFLGFKSAGTLFGASPDLLKKIYASYPGEMLEKLGKLGRGLSERWDAELFGRGLGLAAIVMGGCLLLGLIVFSRRDLQA